MATILYVAFIFIGIIAGTTAMRRGKSTKEVLIAGFGMMTITIGIGLVGVISVLSQILSLWERLAR